MRYGKSFSIDKSTQRNYGRITMSTGQDSAFISLYFNPARVGLYRSREVKDRKRRYAPISRNKSVIEDVFKAVRRCLKSYGFEINEGSGNIIFNRHKKKFVGE